MCCNGLDFTQSAFNEAGLAILEHGTPKICPNTGTAGATLAVPLTK